MDDGGPRHDSSQAELTIDKYQLSFPTCSRFRAVLIPEIHVFDSCHIMTQFITGNLIPILHLL